MQQPAEHGQHKEEAVIPPGKTALLPQEPRETCKDPRRPSIPGPGNAAAGCAASPGDQPRCSRRCLGHTDTALPLKIWAVGAPPVSSSHSPQQPGWQRH